MEPITYARILCNNLFSKHAFVGILHSLSHIITDIFKINIYRPESLRWLCLCGGCARLESTSGAGNQRSACTESSTSMVSTCHLIQTCVLLPATSGSKVSRITRIKQSDKRKKCWILVSCSVFLLPCEQKFQFFEILLQSQAEKVSMCQ